MFPSRSSSVIDVDSIHVSLSKCPKNWLKNSLCTLTEADRDILLSSSERINDSLITAAQNILKHQSNLKYGFQSPCLSQTYAFTPTEEAFIQIVHIC